MNHAVESEWDFCTGSEHLFPWLELSDYCRRLMRDVFAILNRDCSQSDAELRERLRRIHEARRELELFRENQNEIYRDEPFILVQICRVWNNFLRDWISGTNMSLFILDTTSRRLDN